MFPITQHSVLGEIFCLIGQIFMNQTDFDQIVTFSGIFLLQKFEKFQTLSSDDLKQKP